MTDCCFLDKIVPFLHSISLKKAADTIAVLSNKGAKIFLIKALKKQVEKIFFVLEINGIEV
jgi:hypothetical protein